MKNKGIKIILADSHGLLLGKNQSSANLSLLYLASYIRKNVNFKVDFIYLPQSKSEKERIKIIEDFKPDIYAISFTSYAAKNTYKLINIIKNKFPEVLIVCGGPHATPSSKDIFDKSLADICVLNEGEVTFLEIVENIKNIHSVKKQVKGISYIENGEFIITPQRSLISDINTIPFPARDLVDDTDFCGLVYRKARPNTEMVVIRGCPFRCVFCANPVFRIKDGPLFRARSPENIAEEVEQLYQLGYREIFIHSDELNLNLDWSIKVCKALANLNHKDLYFQTHLRVLPMSNEFAYWLKKANFWLVKIGIESTSNRVLAGIKKKMDHKHTIKACKILSKHGIKVFGFLMLFNFWEENGKMEHDTILEVKQTKKDIYKLWLKGYMHYISWEISRPVQGSEFYNIALKHNLIKKNYYPDDNWSSYKFLNNINKKEFNKIYKSVRLQQAIMMFKSGNFELRNYKGIIRKAKTILFGIREG